MRIPFGAFEPDKPPSLSEGLQAATNVYAGPLGYRPVRQFVGLLPALAGRCLGAASFVSPLGNTSIIAGTSTKLYRAKPTSWEEVGTGYTLQNDARWRFAQFGGLAVATNGNDPMVKIDLEGITASPLGGTPPRAKLLAVVKDFLVAGVVNNDVRMVSWSGINNAEHWAAGTNQADFQIMPTGGEVTGLLGGESGLILQRGRIVRMTYVGDNLVFQFDEISYNVGCVSVHSVVQWGNLGFFLSDNGFMMWDGAQLRPIGQERVDRTFMTAYGRADWPQMSTAVDVVNSLVCWAMADRMFVYSWVLDRWSIIDTPATIVFSGFSRDMTLEELGELYGTMEAVPYSLDDDRFKGGNPRFYLFNSSNVLGTFSGANMAADLELGDRELVPGREARVNAVRPITDAVAGLTVTAEARQRLGDAATATEYSYLSDSGSVPMRESGRFVRLGLEIEAGADWSYAQGMDVVRAAGGRR